MIVHRESATVEACFRSGRLPGIEAWPELVPPDAPCPVPVIGAHLRAMDQPVASTPGSAAGDRR